MSIWFQWLKEFLLRLGLTKFVCQMFHVVTSIFPYNDNSVMLNYNSWKISSKLLYLSTTLISYSIAVKLTHLPDKINKLYLPVPVNLSPNNILSTAMFTLILLFYVIFPFSWILVHKHTTHACAHAFAVA